MIDIDSITLAKGAHPRRDATCVMEAVALLAGEKWSDTPQCASPVIAAFLRNWNDNLDDDKRQELKRYIQPLVNSRGTQAQEDERSWMALDWLARAQVPAWLRLAGLTAQAEAIEACAPIVGPESARAAQEALDDGRRKAAAVTAAAGDAAEDAAWAAAGAAVRAAAGDAAWDAARAAAWAAAWAAAGAAAWAAAWAAAGDAARDALAPTVAMLQGSAHDLVARMLAVTEKVAA